MQFNLNSNGLRQAIGQPVNTGGAAQSAENDATLASNQNAVDSATQRALMRCIHVALSSINQDITEPSATYRAISHHNQLDGSTVNHLVQENRILRNQLADSQNAMMDIVDILSLVMNPPLLHEREQFERELDEWVTSEGENDFATKNLILECFDLQNGIKSNPTDGDCIRDSGAYLRLDRHNKTIPNCIGKLVGLKTLVILSYELTSHLPESIGNLTNLTTLTLYKTRLRQLPRSIGNLINLERLKIVVEQLRELPAGMGNLRSLRELDIFLQEQDGAELPHRIGTLELPRLF